MTGEPPLSDPSFQVNPIWSASVTEASFAKARGLSGIVNMTAPLPSLEANELPITF